MLDSEHLFRLVPMIPDFVGIANLLPIFGISGLLFHVPVLKIFHLERVLYEPGLLALEVPFFDDVRFDFGGVEMLVAVFLKNVDHVIVLLEN